MAVQRLGEPAAELAVPLFGHRKLTDRSVSSVVAYEIRMPNNDDFPCLFWQIPVVGVTIAYCSSA